MIEVALMIPSYIDVFYPQVGIATLELLERLGVDVVYPKEQTYCGQPMANSGCYQEARATEEHCAKVFGSFKSITVLSRAVVRLPLRYRNVLERYYPREQSMKETADAAGLTVAAPSARATQPSCQPRKKGISIADAHF